jgi:MFS family permease
MTSLQTGARRPDTAAAAVLAVGQFCVVAAFQATAIVLPAIGTDLHVAPAELQWLVSATALGYGGLLPVAGRLADRFGVRKAFALGTFALSLASIAAAAASTFTFLIAARFAQGAAMAAYTPAMLGLLRHGFETDPARRRALIWWNAAGGIGGILAVVAGGALAQPLGWRPVLLLIAVPALAVAITAGRVFDEPLVPAAGGRVQPLGGLLVSLAAAGLVLTLTLAQRQEAQEVTWILLVASTGLTGLWLLNERRSDVPVVPRRLRRWTKLQPVVVATLHGAAINTPIFFYALFAQEHLKAGPLEVGLGFLPCNIGLILGSWAGGTLHRRVASGRVAATGLCIVALGVAALATVTEDSTLLVPFLPAFLLYGAGASIAQTGFIALAAERGGDDTATLGGLLTAGAQLGTAGALAVLTTLAAVPSSDIVGARLAFVGAATFAITGVIASLGARSQHAATLNLQRP